MSYPRKTALVFHIMIANGQHKLPNDEREAIQKRLLRHSVPELREMARRANREQHGIRGLK